MIGGEELGSPYRRTALNVILSILFVVLVFRLVQLQVVYHEELGRKSEENRIRTIIKEPVRGYMYDRNGRLVVDVGPSFSVFVTPAEFDTSKLPLLSSLLREDEHTIRERITKGRIRSAFSPIRVVRDVDFASLAAVEERVFVHVLPPNLRHLRARRRHDI